MVDLFPLMNHLPLWMANWKKEALDWHARETRRFEGFLKDVESRMVRCRHCDPTTELMVDALRSMEMRHTVSRQTC